MKVALDTNVLMSAIGTRGLCADVLRVVLRDHELVVGAQVLDEMRRNLSKKWRLPAALVDEYEALLRREAAALPDAAPVDLAGVDAGDAKVLGDAMAGGADLLVTGDGELLAPGSRAPLPIASPRQFWERLRRGK